jgi:diguanylate cyclase (GGDEF)-like protein
MNFILVFFDLFLPASLRSNPSDLMRGYILIGLIFANILTCVLVLLGILYYLDLESSRNIAIALTGMCLLGYFLTLWMLVRSGNSRLCSTFIISILTFVIFFAIQITGGYLDSPVLQLVLQLPVIAFLLLGLRAGIKWLITTLVLCIFSYCSAVFDVGYVQLLNEAAVEGMYIFLQFILLGMVGGALIIYETINSLLNQRLHEEKNKFEHKASHDDLTGIANRFEFFRRLKMAIDEAQGRDHKVGLVYIDLDGFKPVNDIYGHQMGDEALKIIAGRLKSMLRLSDTTARLGGDEFALILPGIHVPGDIEVVMPKILAAIKEPIFVNEVEVVVYGSCGVAIYPDHSEDHSVLCRYADVAMYQAKEKQDAYQVFDKTMLV